MMKINFNSISDVNEGLPVPQLTNMEMPPEPNAAALRVFLKTSLFELKKFASDRKEKLSYDPAMTELRIQRTRQWYEKEGRRQAASWSVDHVLKIIFMT